MYENDFWSYPNPCRDVPWNVSTFKFIPGFSNAGFSKWFGFGGFGIIAHNDPIEQEKIIKYNDLIANAVIFHNVVDLTDILSDLKREGHLVTRDDVAVLSPYMTSHIKRFGDYLIDLNAIPQSLDEISNFNLI